MKKIFIGIFFIFLSTGLLANCDSKLFSFSIKNQNVSLLNVLENISDECHMSLVFNDDEVRKMVGKPLNYINIKDVSLNELLNLLLNNNDISYKITDNKKVIQLYYKMTKTFFIDYVSFTKRKSSGNQVVKTGSSSSSNNNDNGNNNNNNNNSNSNSGSSNSSGTGSTSIDFESEFKFWDKIQSEINFILSQGKSVDPKDVLINQDAGMVTVTGTKKQLDRVGAYIKKMMKRLHKEILVEAKVIEVQYNDSKSTGIDWSQFDLALSAQSDAMRTRSTNSVGMGGSDKQEYTPLANGFVNTFRNPNYLVGYSFSMQGLLNFLKTQGDVKIVSNPKIMTLNNQPAIINVGEEINYRYQTGSTTNLSSDSGNTVIDYDTDSTFVGVTLDITPQVTDDGYIVLKINPVVSEVSKEHVDKTTGVPYLAPDVKIRQLSSIVRVKDGDKVLIGGLISKKDTIDDTSVPVLSKIPLLGKAFQSSSKSKTKSEMIIVLIPHVVNGSQTPDLESLDEHLKEEL